MDQTSDEKMKDANNNNNKINKTETHAETQTETEGEGERLLHCWSSQRWHNSWMGDGSCKGCAARMRDSAPAWRLLPASQPTKPTSQPAGWCQTIFTLQQQAKKFQRNIMKEKNMKWKRFHSCCRNVTARRTSSHVLCVAFGLVDLHGASSKWTKRKWNLTGHEYPVKGRKLRRTFRRRFAICNMHL